MIYISTSKAADPEFRPSTSSIQTYHYLLDLCSGELGNVFDKHPQRLLFWTTHRTL